MLNFDYKAPRTRSEAISMLPSKREIRALAGGIGIISQLTTAGGMQMSLSTSNEFLNFGKIVSDLISKPIQL